MSAEIIPFPSRRKAKRKRPVQPPVREPEAEPGSLVAKLNEAADAWRRWSAPNEAAIAGILDDARNAGRWWP